MKIFCHKKPQNLVKVFNCCHVNSISIIAFCMPHWREWNWNYMQDGDTWKRNHFLLQCSVRHSIRYIFCYIYSYSNKCCFLPWKICKEMWFHSFWESGQMTITVCIKICAAVWDCFRSTNRSKFNFIPQCLRSFN